MNRLLALALVCSATTTFARPPMPAPVTAGPIQHQVQYSPTPAPTPMVPSTAGALPAGGGTLVYSAQPGLAPIPAGIPAGQIVCDACNGGGFSLYNRVKVLRTRNIAPCAVSKIVSVPDPCNPCNVVFIEICVPPCACETIECHPHRNRTVFNYGKYEVRVTERHGTLVVNYED